MKKRIAIGLLWFYCIWCAWSMIAALAGMPIFAGPILGALVGAFVVGDPFHRIWTLAPAPVAPTPLSTHDEDRQAA